MPYVEGYENAYFSMTWLGPQGYPENANAGRCYFTPASWACTGSTASTTCCSPTAHPGTASPSAGGRSGERRTRSVKAAEMVVDSATSIMIGADYAAAFCRRARFQFQGRSSSTLLAEWSGKRARTSVSQASGSTSLSLAVSISV